ncbi:MAG: GNAT family N-acetyltransferase [Rhizobiales bacterium]|nr:GNAT family N-acetyltransferase [Hyphomicrobiales bacterium]
MNIQYSRIPIETRVARTFDEVVMAMTLRGVTYLGEQNAPYTEEYDGNDLVAASHLVAWQGREPVGVLRLRWFAEFAKVERAAVLPAFRKIGVMRTLMADAMKYCARRGYRKLLGHAQIERLPYWRSHGFEVRHGRPQFSFSDYQYVEILKILERPSDVIDMDAPPLVLIRPDGDWDRPGAFDLSTSRDIRPANQPIRVA